MAKKRRALISVADKRYITNLARDLDKLGYDIVSTGGTFKKIKEAGIPVKELSRVFKTPEMLDGRVKTIHPNVHAAILADRENPDHVKQLKKLSIVPFDMVVVNFYPFETKVTAGKTSITDAIELIDIGGPAMVRAAAKNFRNVTVISNVEQYRDTVKLLKDCEGELPEEHRMSLALEAFLTTQQYDSSVAAYFEYVKPKDEELAQAPTELLKELLPSKLTINLRRADTLRYGENPHQEGARYAISGLPTLPYKVLQGKEMSYNNFLDAAAALTAVSADYPREHVVCVVKHLNPCGIAVGDKLVPTFIKAREADPKSAFGGIVGLNQPVDLALAKEIRRTFFELIVAPGFDADALEHLSSKKNLRLIEADPAECQRLMLSSPRMAVTLFGAMLQGYDTINENWDELEVVTNIAPPDDMQEDILLGLKFIRFLKSNSLCLVKDRVMIGRGLGQMSRVDAAEIALKSAGRKAKGAILISDGFFPFSDTIEIAAKAKVGCIVSPAGSKRDMEVVAAANKLEVPLVFTPHRHFLH